MKTPFLEFLRRRVQTIVGLLACFLGPTLLMAQSPGPPIFDDEPVEVEVTFHLQKIYDIDIVEETYAVDGYRYVSWSDPRLAGSEDSADRVYENKDAEQLLGTRIWWPMLEYMNIVGKPEVVNRRVRIEASGRVQLKERFNATFASEMDFHRFPFDDHLFQISLESFSYGGTEVRFVAGDLRIPNVHSDYPEWKSAGEPVACVTKFEYFDSAGHENDFSHYTLKIPVERDPGYFIWQFFFPLGLIIVSAWSVFWVSGNHERLSITFTLMLTVVAFNFYTATLVPRLPYNTFIEIIVISGYLTIFLTILALIYSERRGPSWSEERRARIDSRFRWLFPAGYFVFIFALVLRYHILEPVGVDLTNLTCQTVGVVW